jgi:ubiquinone/menaquinone biosynthesis C-methylase UbiE
MITEPLIDLSERATEPEQLDVGVPEEEARRSLGDIRLVNRWLGGRAALLRTLRPFLEASDRPGTAVRLLDVGCGSADLPAVLLSRFPARLMAVGVDVKLLHLREAPPEIRRVAADVRALPFAPASFDVVTASLFLHHFDPPEVACVLRSLYRVARRVLVVNDLRRARAAYLFARGVFPWLFRSRVSVADGLLSIRRAFTASELREAFAEAGIPDVRVRRHFPYRLVAVAQR